MQTLSKLRQKRKQSDISNSKASIKQYNFT